jgi:hypothetical protein
MTRMLAPGAPPAFFFTEAASNDGDCAPSGASRTHTSDVATIRLLVTDQVSVGRSIRSVEQAHIASTN